MGYAVSPDGAWRVVQDASWVKEGETFSAGKPGPREPSPEQKQQDELAKINADCEAQLAAIRSRYPLSEILTWSKQEDEARAHQAGKAVDTPLLAGIATARGISIDNLAARVIAKADAYTLLVSQAIGVRQQLEDQLEKGDQEMTRR